MALPVALLIASLAGLTLYCRQLLDIGGRGDASADSGAIWAAGAFLVASGFLVVLQTMKVANRVAGPEYRLIQTVRRIRSGDLTMRVHLRRGDLLRELAHECNELIEWLNRNPPKGAETGGDLIEMDHIQIADAEAASEPVQRRASEAVAT